MICFGFLGIAKATKVEIPFKIDRQTLILLVVFAGLGALFILGMGAWFLTAFAAPFCIYWMYRFFRYRYKAKLIPLQYIFKYFNLFAVIILILALLYSYAYFMDNDRLIEKLDHHLSKPTARLIMKKNDLAVVPRVNQIVEDYDISDFSSKITLLNSIRILRHFKSKSSAHAIESAFRKTGYPSKKQYMDDILVESAKAYALIEGEEAKEAILDKIIDIVNDDDFNRYWDEDVVKGLLEAARLAGENTIDLDVLNKERDSVHAEDRAEDSDDQ